MKRQIIVVLDDEGCKALNNIEKHYLETYQRKTLKRIISDLIIKESKRLNKEYG